MDIEITNIQKFCIHDGPGIRTTVFLSGCPLRCAWCHNPETQKAAQQLMFNARLCVGCGKCASVCPSGAHGFSSGIHTVDRSKCIICGKCIEACPVGALSFSKRVVNVDNLFKEILKDKIYYGADGGVTFSGGEPMNVPEVLFALLERAKKEGLDTAIESSAYWNPRYAERLVGLVDTFLLDMKDSVSERHRKYVGVPNELIWENFRLVDSLGGRIIMRCIIVEGVNTDMAHFEGIAELWGSLRNSPGVELLPFHVFGQEKINELGRKDVLPREWIPSEERMSGLRELLTSMGVVVLN